MFFESCRNFNQTLFWYTNEQRRLDIVSITSQRCTARSINSSLTAAVPVPTPIGLVARSSAGLEEKKNRISHFLGSPHRESSIGPSAVFNQRTHIIQKLNTLRLLCP